MLSSSAPKPRVLPLLGLLPSALLALLGASACEENYYSNTYVMSEGGAGGEAGGGGAAGEGGADYPDAPAANTTVAEFSIDLFGTMGHRFWFAASEEQLTKLNAAVDGFVEDLYTPDAEGNRTYADHLWVTTAGKKPKTADFGQVEVRLAGQSTRRSWTPTTIPNLNLDTDDFTEKQKLDGYEHLRFNNAQVGSIYRERLTLEVMDRLGYPAPLANYVWVSSNIWGTDVSIPYVLVERYKPGFCERWKKQLGGGCPNMWEFVGDFNGGGGWVGNPMPVDIAMPEVVVPSLFDDPNNCQFAKCDGSRVKELEQKLRETPQGSGFKKALASYVHWPSFHRFQCLSWILAVGDDTLHNGNNVVLVERGDGRFQYLPYSVDISLGQSWYPTVPLYGASVLASGCQSDEACWADTITTCEDEITAFRELEPVELLDTINGQLEKEGMLREGDEARYEVLRSWLEARVDSLADELSTYRELPSTGVMCFDGQIDCGDGTCAYPGGCGVVCAPPDMPIEGLEPCPVDDVPVPL